MNRDPSPSQTHPTPVAADGRAGRINQLLGDDLSGAGRNGHEDGRLIRLNAAAIADALCGVVSNASIVLRRQSTGFEVVDAGPRARIDRLGLPASTIELSLNDHLLLPALVNAHTHLDLTHLGPRPHEPGDGFVGWVEMVRAGRADDDEQIALCVEQGIEKSLAGGCIAVGDIAGAPKGRLTDAPARALGASPMIGVSYLEFFGIGTTAARATGKINDYLQNRSPRVREALLGSGVELGLQPHAPNTVDLGVYRWAARAGAARGMPLSTHLAETPEERAFIAHARGPQRAMLERLGIWDGSVLDHIGHGRHPVEHLAPLLGEYPMLLAHVNDATDHAIELLTQTHASVAYCPRASAYFGAPAHFGAHRYRDMLSAGVNVCLGTDSIVNLETPDRITVLDDMRLLWAQGQTDPSTLLAMGTVAGARALGLDERAFTLSPGSSPRGLIAVKTDPGAPDAWGSAMSRVDAPCWVFLVEK